MIFDHRIYGCRPGSVEKQLELYDRYGREAQIECLGGEPLLYGPTDTGALNSIINVWAFESIGERADFRARLAADPRWTAYVEKTLEAGYLVVQQSRILWPAPFFKATRLAPGGGTVRKALFDHRTYTCHPGKVMAELKLYGELGFQAQLKYLGQPVVYAYAESGKLNGYTHVWMFDSAEDRAAKRLAMSKDPDWQEFRRQSETIGNRMMQETHIMVAAPFWRK